jgi:hypothetical protein
MPATKKKFLMNTLSADMFLHPIKENDKVVGVVEKAPIARAVGFLVAI